MTTPNSSNLKDNLFYVDEAADDFTFYLATDKADTDGKTAWDLLSERLRVVPAGEKNGSKHFSFSEKIRIRSLALSKDCLKPGDDKLWPELAKRTSGCGYLRTEMQRLQKEKLAGADSKQIRGLLLKVLNQTIKQDNLARRGWVIRRLTAPEKHFLKTVATPVVQNRWRQRFWLEKTFASLIKQTQLENLDTTGRGLFCLSYAGNYVSVTFRKLKAKAGYEAEGYGPLRLQQKKREKHLFSLKEYCDQLYEEVVTRTNSKEHAHGLLVVTGSTNSAKSEIARGMIFKYLTNKARGGRIPHLVTFEDPIESGYVEPRKPELSDQANVAVEMPSTKLSEAIDYTPREKEKDASLLTKALQDALRQTPAVFFVGETRKKKEWERLLDFAATGHLIVTTAHAASLVEAMHKIFEAREAKTAADRGEIANKLLAVIHLGSDTIPIITKDGEVEATSALFPTVWRRTPRGVAALTCDGLASLLPHRPRENANPGALSCLGRRWFMNQLVEKASEQLVKLKGSLKDLLDAEFALTEEETPASTKARAFKRATEWDLKGV
jgi:hypothetical protein